MKDRSLEKLLYKLAILLVIGGAAVRLLGLSENFLGLHLILSGLMTGVVAILLHMRYMSELEQKKANLKEKKLKSR